MNISIKEKSSRGENAWYFKAWQFLAWYYNSFLLKLRPMSMIQPHTCPSTFRNHFSSDESDNDFSESDETNIKSEPEIALTALSLVRSRHTKFTDVLDMLENRKSRLPWKMQFLSIRMVEKKEFTCEPCELGKSKKQIFEDSPEETQSTKSQISCRYPRNETDWTRCPR